MHTNHCGGRISRHFRSFGLPFCLLRNSQLGRATSRLRDWDGPSLQTRDRLNLCIHARRRRNLKLHPPAERDDDTRRAQTVVRWTAKVLRDGNSSKRCVAVTHSLVWLARPSHLIARALRAERNGLAAVTISSHLF